ncbi:hypothetical protein GGU10DRAFT_334095 [Lentinula aff. detonsa]|uniref:Uncharacterized protein n=1 Tax=Lentinula aff. detonsa TaxID=2804958 RepID=A0AA38KRA1_9AGAR|nr:hypothetical protein GGU10DRAFT_334095 [Lentinula aff. detonsa]
MFPSEPPSTMEEGILQPSVYQNISYRNLPPVPSHSYHKPGVTTSTQEESPAPPSTPSLEFEVTVPSQQPVDSQRLIYEEAHKHAAAAAARAQAPSATPSGSSASSEQFLGRTYPLPSNATTSTLSALLNAPSTKPTHSSSLDIPELPMSPLWLGTSSSKNCQNTTPIPYTSPTRSPPGPAKSPSFSHARDSDQLTKSPMVLVVHPRMGPGERNLRAKGKDTRLSDAVEAVCDYVDSEVKRLAAEHKKSLLTIKKHLGVHRRFREKKKTSLYNALMHRKSQEHRIHGWVFGPSIKEKHQQMACDSDVQSILRNPNGSRARQAMEDLREYQTTKLSGARASGKANDNDIVKTWADLARKAQNLSKRTSAATFGFVCSSRSGQNVHREFFGNGPIEGFLMSKFGMTGTEFVEAAEAYCILTSTGRTAMGMSIKAMQKETTKLILQGLRNITKNEKIVMEYEHYEVLIVKEYGVKLIGWPEDIPMTSPHRLLSANAITLYQVVNSRECQWKQLGNLEKRRIVKDIDVRVENGELDVPERLRRRGKKRTAPTEKEKKRSKQRSRLVSETDAEDNMEGFREGGSGKKGHQVRPKPKRIPKGGKRGGIRTIVSDDETEDELEKSDAERELESHQRYTKNITHQENADDWTDGNDDIGGENGDDGNQNEPQDGELDDDAEGDLHGWDGGIWDYEKHEGEDNREASGDEGDFDELDSDME